MLLPGACGLFLRVALLQIAVYQKANEAYSGCDAKGDQRDGVFLHASASPLMVEVRMEGKRATEVISSQAGSLMPVSPAA